ncbi:MAG TPA: hypothetical protein VH643_09240 [Gemmataceae bacterium]|jgi:WD40 repeat protein
MSGHVSGVRALAFAPDGKTLTSVGGYWENDVRGQTESGSKLRLWDVASGAQIHAPRTMPVGSGSPSGSSLPVLA